MAEEQNWLSNLEEFDRASRSFADGLQQLEQETLTGFLHNMFGYGFSQVYTLVTGEKLSPDQLFARTIAHSAMTLRDPDRYQANHAFVELAVQHPDADMTVPIDFLLHN